MSYRITSAIASSSTPSSVVRGSSVFGKTALRACGSHHSRGFHSSVPHQAGGKRDFYEVLGLDKTATKAQIKKAYYAKAKKYHPDNSKEPDADAKFAEIAEAYKVLSDKDKRQMYDTYGTVDGPGGFGGGRGGAGGQYSAEDIFQEFLQNMGGNAGRPFGGGGGFRGGPQMVRGNDRRVDVAITFEEAVSGVQKEVSFTGAVNCKRCDGNGAEPGSGTVTCPVCRGSGVQTVKGPFFEMQQPCSKCSGVGSVIEKVCISCDGAAQTNERQTLKVSIPPGVDNDTLMRLRGKGDAGLNGGPAGDVHIMCKVGRSRFFERSEYNVTSRVKISLSQALLGGSIRTKSLSGDIDLKIPKFTMHGDKLRLKGKGIPKLNTQNSFGDHLVQLNVDIPRKLSERQHELLLELAMEESPEREGSVNGLDEFIKQKQKTVMTASTGGPDKEGSIDAVSGDKRDTKKSPHGSSGTNAGNTKDASEEPGFFKSIKDKICGDTDAEKR